MRERTSGTNQARQNALAEMDVNLVICAGMEEWRQRRGMVWRSLQQPRHRGHRTCLIKAFTEMPKPSKAKVRDSRTQRYWKGLDDNLIYKSPPDLLHRQRSWAMDKVRVRQTTNKHHDHEEHVNKKELAPVDRNGSTAYRSWAHSRANTVHRSPSLRGPLGQRKGR